jgi:hypothetical protein
MLDFYQQIYYNFNMDLLKNQYEIVSYRYGIVAKWINTQLMNL